MNGIGYCAWLESHGRCGKTTNAFLSYGVSLHIPVGHSITKLISILCLPMTFFDFLRAYLVVLVFIFLSGGEVHETHVERVNMRKDKGYPDEQQRPSHACVL